MTFEEIKAIPSDIDRDFLDLRVYSTILDALVFYRDNLCSGSCLHSLESCDFAVLMVSGFIRQMVDSLDINFSNFKKYYSYSFDCFSSDDF